MYVYLFETSLSLTTNCDTPGFINNKIMLLYFLSSNKRGTVQLNKDTRDFYSRINKSFRCLEISVIKQCFITEIQAFDLCVLPTFHIVSFPKDKSSRLRDDECLHKSDICYCGSPAKCLSFLLSRSVYATHRPTELEIK